MLTPISIFLGSIVIAGLIVVAIVMTRWARTLAKPVPRLQDDACPPAAVVLSLRGGDPFLRDCLERLLEQDYPDYEIVIALDDANDPASQYVDQIIEERQPGNLTKKLISKRPVSCTLLNNNYAEIVRELDSRYEFIVFVDADAVTWPNWLRSLIAPMVRDSSIGGTSGNRWYTPDEPTSGALVRSFWNFGSLLQMASLNYPWGGSMAMRSSIAKSPEMLKCWQSSFTGDTPSFEVIKNAGYKYQFCPDVIVQNRESTSLKDFCNWMPRQMLNGKLYHPSWLPVFLHAVISTLFLTFCFLINFINIATGNWIGLAILGGSLTMFWMGLLLFFRNFDAIILGQEGKTRKNWLGTLTLTKLFLVIPVVQFVYFWGVLKCLTLRRVTWRGIDYEIRKPFDITLVEYKPFRDLQVAGQQEMQSL